MIKNPNVNTIGMDQMRIAYRKAKHDMHFSGGTPAAEIIEYEKSLEENLTYICENINYILNIGLNEEVLDNFLNEKFIGAHAIVPKKERFSTEGSLRSYESDKTFETYLPKNGIKSEEGKEEQLVEFRLMSRCSVGMHVLSALWINEIGAFIDSTLSKKAYGNRIRRTKKGDINNRALGIFEPYLGPYKKWQKGALDALEQALSEEKKVALLSADATSYYHQLDPKFIGGDKYIDYLNSTKGLKIDGNSLTFHRVFVEAVSRWSETTAEVLGLNEYQIDGAQPMDVGLPVGLAASAVIANAALDSFDTFIEEEVAPLYYGRYVDDILIVIENGKDFHQADQLISWLSKRSTENLTVVCQGESNKSKRGSKPELFRIDVPYIGKSIISFSNDKNRLRILGGTAGKAAVDSIRRQMNEDSSEWRALPTLDDGSGSVAARILGAIAESGGTASKLREMDSLTAKRADFSLALRDFEAFERDLDITSWVEPRKEFYDSILDIVITPKGIFSFWPYLSRLVMFSLACGDESDAVRLIKRIKECVKFVLGNSGMSDQYIYISGIGYVESQRPRSLAEEVESLVWDCFVRVGISDEDKSVRILKKLGYEFPTSPSSDPPLFAPNSTPQPENSINGLADLGREVFLADLGHRPARWLAIPEEIRPLRGLEGIKEIKGRQVQYNLHTSMSGNINEISLMVKAGFGDLEVLHLLSNAIFYPTRPFNDCELSLISNSSRVLGRAGIVDSEQMSQDAQNEIVEQQFNDIQKNVAALLSALRGYGESKDNVSLEIVAEDSGMDDRFGAIGEGKYYLINIRDSVDGLQNRKGEIRVGLGVFETSMEQFERAARGMPDSSLARYLRFSDCLNAATERRQKPMDYVLFPELSIPTRWFVPFARKLGKSNINLIGGVEYLREGNHVSNQVWAALSHGSYGYPALYIHRQDKQRPAVHEKEHLTQLDGLSHVPRIAWGKWGPSVISHNGFIFGLLVCSELTNIQYRSHFRGRVDALFVPEWNRDLGSFESLVEASALDLHCYVAQANNREFGDSRVRVPDAKNYKRDVIKHLGGDIDYVVSCALDVESLRRFQSSGIGYEKRFKPVPDGFRLAKNRVAVPPIEK